MEEQTENITESLKNNDVNKNTTIDNKNDDEQDKKIDNINIIELIKSNYIVKQLFTYLCENVKLNLVKYNKIIQNKLEIDIDAYKRKSGKYKIKGINGNGKEYLLNTNILIFDGEYINGKRNGRGKEFEEGIIKFEGEYKNGKRTGEGTSIEYNRGKKIFVGEYKEGKRNGKGKRYYNGLLIFEGEYLDGKRWKGKGKKINESGKVIYEGEYLYGKMWNGKEYVFEENELKFIREYKEGNLIYEGEYKNGKRDGKGKEYNKEGKIILYFIR